MTSAPAISDTTSIPRLSSRARAHEDPGGRLRLKPKAPKTGWVDGGWWPRSRDLAAERVTLLVVAPEASAPTARAVLMAAGRRGNTDNVDTLLRSRPLAADDLGSADGQWEAALQRWEVDGGPMIGVRSTQR
jgi:Family of unknown function (DUF5994)